MIIDAGPAAASRLLRLAREFDRAAVCVAPSGLKKQLLRKVGVARQLDLIRVLSRLGLP